MSEAEFVVSTFDSSLLVSKPHIWNNIDWTFEIKQRSLYIAVIGWTILEDPSRRSRPYMDNMVTPLILMELWRKKNILLNPAGRG